MLVTLDEFKAFLDITDSNADYKLDLLLKGAYEQAQVYTGRKFEQAEYTEFAGDAREVRVYYPKNIPIVSISDFIIEGDILTDTDYNIMDDEKIVLAQPYELTDPDSLELIYTAGWTTDNFPFDLRMAIYKLAIRTDMISKSMNADSNFLTYSYKEITDVLDKYKYVGL